MRQHYEVIVIGTGAAGTTAAAICNKEGKKVAIIDERELGGTCALRGCDAKKIFTGLAELVDWNQRMSDKGIVDQAETNWEDILSFKNKMKKGFPEQKEAYFEKYGIDVYRGIASFYSEKEVKVGNAILSGDYIVIATGAKPRELPFEGANHLITSEEFLDLEQLPEKMVFVGGGYISFEFAHITSRLGVETHIIEFQDRVLQNFEKNMVDKMLEKSAQAGIQIHLETSVEKIEEQGTQYKIIAEKDGKSFEMEAGVVVNGAGRIPNIESLNLEKGKVSYSEKGIEVNQYLQSPSNPAVYAAGDVSHTKGLPLTPVAGVEGAVVGENIIKGNSNSPDYSMIATTLFTIPKISAAGMSEEEAKKQGIHYEIKQKDMSDWYSYKRTNDGHAMCKVLIDPNSDLILGVQAVGGYADHIVNHLALAIKHKIPVGEIQAMMYSYPSIESDLQHILK